jgi:hypothetical protein
MEQSKFRFRRKFRPSGGTLGKDECVLLTGILLWITNDHLGIGRLVFG